jgi:hypothetical protein
MPINTTLFGIMLALFSPAVLAGTECASPSKLTDDEAKILLYVTPAAVSARGTGTDVDIEKSSPTKQFPAQDYFVAEVVSQGSAGGGVLGNGVLGYFAVDRRTASVEFLGDFTLVKGKELARVQQWIRNAHCIRSPLATK